MPAAIHAGAAAFARSCPNASHAQHGSQSMDCSRNQVESAVTDTVD
jgi:hypothetical protein